MDTGKSRFHLGQVVLTRGVNDLAAENDAFTKFVMESLHRHTTGDWGDLCNEDQRANDYALGKYLRIFSAYNHKDKKIWIITEADRSATTVLFPDEY
jgi:hypothetical protein